MEDVTALTNIYRECIRHLWNTYFWREAEPTQDWDLRDEFNEVAADLFRCLVLRPLNRGDMRLRPDRWSERQPLHFLHIEIDSCSRIMVNRGLDTGYWDHPLALVEKAELDVRFL